MGSHRRPYLVAVQSRQFIFQLTRCSARSSAPQFFCTGRGAVYRRYTSHLGPAKENPAATPEQKNPKSTAKGVRNIHPWAPLRYCAPEHPWWKGKCTSCSWLVSPRKPLFNSIKVTCASRHTQRLHPCKKRWEGKCTLGPYSLKRSALVSP